jgi:hypothetical protein
MNAKELQEENALLRSQVLSMQETVKVYRDLISRQSALSAKFSAKQKTVLSAANELDKAVQRIVEGKDSAGFRFVQGNAPQRV